MARYIDADALLDSLMGYKRYISIQFGELEMLGCDVVKQCIDSAPTATLPIKDKCAFCPHCTNCDVNDDLSIKQTEDVLERKKGEWILQEDKTQKHYGWNFCSECGAWIGEPTNFCSECGADMRGNNNDN